MHWIDGLIIALYLIGALALGAYLSRRASQSVEDFFISGRSLPWWLAGTSMAATTFSIDTPLYVAGVVGERGIAGNWEWWAFGVGHVALIYVFARLWRRSAVVTDAELIEMRYSGRPAAVLRVVKAFLFAVPINCIGIGYIMLAALKVMEALSFWSLLGIPTGGTVLGLDPKMLSVLVLLVFVLLYAGLSGLWGVVATDFVQFVLALIGAVLVAWFAIRSPEVGGLSGLVTQAQAATDFDVLAFVPFEIGWDDGLRIGWSAFAGISASTFFAYAFVQWWTFRRSDGGGEFIQRLVASRDEQHAEWAAWLFNILHYVIRTWPWVLVALAALVVYPDLEDPEMGYPKLMLDYLPVGVLGLAVASLLAAFMSTVSTQINWGASYLTHDVYARFVRPEATQDELVLAGRAASLLIATIGAVAAFFSESVATIFRLVIAIGTGPGVVLILRWFWWRINAWAELSAMCAGFLIGLTTTLYPGAIIDDFGLRLGAITVLTGIVWISVMYATKPESAKTLRRFYRMARPGGPGWARQRAETGVAPAASLSRSIWSTVAAVGLLFGTMFATGGALLLRPAVAVGCSSVALVSGYALYRLRQGAAPIIESEEAPSASP
ncbi:sodium:proline symporter [Longimonas halophila]|uniref:Sodium:proline symporter n=1 Tax=Longimonas halophila TaxID=1469170 RepID=A0A2H3NRY9_9BACT|nr:sodium:proline symporter [Longimonas halophila]